MTQHKNRRLAALAAGSATALVATAGIGVASAAAAPAAPAATTKPGTNAPGHANKTHVKKVNHRSTTASSRLKYGRAQVAAKGQKVSAAKAAAPAKKKRGRSRMS